MRADKMVKNNCDNGYCLNVRGENCVRLSDHLTKLTAAQAEIARLQSALDVAVEVVTVLRAYPLDIRAQLKADEALEKIKRIKNSTQ